MRRGVNLIHNYLVKGQELEGRGAEEKDLLQLLPHSPTPSSIQDAHNVGC
jgi:hypothetical protein